MAGAPSTAATNLWDAGAYAENAGFVPALGNAALELLAPRAGERILDLGCGDGVLTEKIVAAGADVRGVDFDEGMVAAARARGITADVADGQALAFDAEYDAVFSNAALHWMPDHDAVFSGVAKALKPGGRFVAECGGFGNIAAMRTALRAVLARRGLGSPDQQNYPTVAAATRQLEAAGFSVETCVLVPRATPLAAGMAAWFHTFRHGFLPEEGRDEIIAEIAELLRPSLCDGDGNWTADYVRLRFKAVKTA
ncbi:methyltransferase domain-containing protein [Pacificimonas sp. WHA3]|uniref:Methyltransferase domain-containing protein n=1 Tax=Pacificimonas pallii TaxID=2827236 RepID=A0ABS6SH76_9SPHN|nr:class I SAM-dependent methyltransferase [Pacificimonas pallii]MBV7257767.1 methyltransferase domain-containing protein [Pacificimonas pallii]